MKLKFASIFTSLVVTKKNIQLLRQGYFRKRAATVFETRLSLKEITEAGDIGGATRPSAVPRQSQELRSNHKILGKTKLCNYEAGDLHAIWIIQGFIKQQNDKLLSVLELKNFVAPDSVLKLYSRLSFYFRYTIAEMA